MYVHFLSLFPKLQESPKVTNNVQFDFFLINLFLNRYYMSMVKKKLKVQAVQYNLSPFHHLRKIWNFPVFFVCVSFVIGWDTDWEISLAAFSFSLLTQKMKSRCVRLILQIRKLRLWNLSEVAQLVTAQRIQAHLCLMQKPMLFIKTYSFTPNYLAKICLHKCSLYFHFLPTCSSRSFWSRCPMQHQV